MIDYTDFALYAGWLGGIEPNPAGGPGLSVPAARSVCQRGVQCAGSAFSVPAGCSACQRRVQCAKGFLTVTAPTSDSWPSTFSGSPTTRVTKRPGAR